MEIKVVVEFIGNVKYDFTDKKTGEQISGVCRKAVLGTYRGGDLVDLRVEKLSKDCKVSVGDSGVLPLFDRFGKFVGFRG